MSTLMTPYVGGRAGTAVCNGEGAVTGWARLGLAGETLPSLCPFGPTRPWSWVPAGKGAPFPDGPHQSLFSWRLGSEEVSSGAPDRSSVSLRFWFWGEMQESPWQKGQAGAWRGGSTIGRPNQALRQTDEGGQYYHSKDPMGAIQQIPY